ncbi:hypothetical protein [Aliihoeflea sp. PC F10.4]
MTAFPTFRSALAGLDISIERVRLYRSLSSYPDTRNLPAHVRRKLGLQD